MEMQASGDTKHLYDGKTVRSSAPSRKKLAGNAGSSSEIPADAIPEVHLPSFVESLLGGPLVPKMKFLPPDSMVRNLQLASYGVTIMLALLTYIISPPQGTIWYTVSGSIGVAGTMQFIVILGALVTGFYGSLRRDGRFHLISYLLFILAVMRFASDRTDLTNEWFDLADRPGLLNGMVVLYAVLLVMNIELSDGVIRFSMLDTSIKTKEVYVMNVKKVVSRYTRALVYNPVIAALLAILVLSANTILPFFIRLLDPVSADRLGESVELVSVYGVAIGTLIVFVVVGIMFAANLPMRLQKWQESRGE